MSSIAKKMLERHGWREGMGLGRNAGGVSTYVKVIRRDPRTATGLGHAADATQAPQAATLSAELDAVYSDMTRLGGKNKSKNKKELEVVSSDEEDNNKMKRSGSDVMKTRKREREVTRKGGSSRSSSCNSGGGDCCSQSSSSSDESSSDDDTNVDITRLKDDELLRRCGGVRLGRAGRHRFFDGKLRRIEKSHREE